MKSYHIPVAQWSVQDVQEWLTDLGLGKLNEAIEHNAVSGSDLIELAQEDLLADLGATSIQARKVKNELSKLGAPIALQKSPSSGSYEYPPQSPAASGYPMPGAGFQGHPNYPPPAGYPPAYPPPGYMPYPPPDAAPKQLESATSEMAEMKRQLDEAASQAKIAEMERQLHAEKMKNDMRKEIDMSSRLAATEAAQRASSSATPIVISNNNNNAASGAGGGGGGAGSGGLGAGVPRLANAKSTYIVQETTENYCGFLSTVLFFCFPCIICCPVDERTVEHRTKI